MLALLAMESEQFATLPSCVMRVAALPRGNNMNDFNCRMVYYTPAGHRRTAYAKTRAETADSAIVIAERQLRSDKRRHIGVITHGEAIKQ